MADTFGDAKEYSKRDISQIVQETKKDPSNAQQTFTVIGRFRPEASPFDQMYRERSLGHHRRLIEEVNGYPPVEIVQSDRAESTTLELQPLLLGTLLTTGSWQKEFLRRHYNIDDGRDMTKLLSTRASREAATRRLEKIMGAEPFTDLVADHLESVLEKSKTQEIKYAFGRLTVGLELEIYRNAKRYYKTSDATQSKKIDSLQEVGLPIEYDAMREVPLPYSKSTHEQLKALLLLIQSGMIEYACGVHLNIGGLKRLDDNLVVLQKMAVASGLFETEIGTNSDFHPLSDEQDHWAKPLMENDVFSPTGLPFVVRTNGVIEFRWIPDIKNFKKSAKGLETFVLACEAIASWQKVHDNDFDVTAKDIELAATWDTMKEEALAHFETFGFSRETIEYFDRDAEEYANLDSRIRSAVTTDKSDEFNKMMSNVRAERRNKMLNIFISHRGAIKNILQKKPEKELAEMAL